MPQITSSKRPRDGKTGATRAKATKGHKKVVEGAFWMKGGLLGSRRMFRRFRRAARTAVKQTLDLIRVNDKVVYPFRQAITVRVSVADRGYRATSPQLNELFATAHPTLGAKELPAIGQTRKQAIRRLAERFHAVVEEHRVPVHERTELDERVNEILDRLVDWDKYNSARPVKEPLWGKLLALGDDGSARVFWLVGPRGLVRCDATLVSGDVPDQLRELEPNEWFYATAYVLPNRIKWVERPVEVPNPYDEEAFKSAWDKIPIEVMSDQNAWPLKKSEMTHGGA